MDKKTTPSPCDRCKNISNSIFCSMGKNELALLSAGKTFNLYQKKQVIFYEGGQPQGLYCIYSGRVKIHKIRDDGKEQIVRLAKDGSVIGYRSLLVSDN